MDRSKTYSYYFIGLGLLFILCLVLNLSLGSIHIPFTKVFSVIFNQPIEKETWEYIILNYRLPKAFTAVLVGAGLSVSGLLMQTLFRNPLAGPYVLGLSSGASLGVAIVILGATFLGGNFAALFMSKWSLIIASSIGSFFVLLAVVLVSSKIKDTMAILIIGLMFASITAAVVSVLSYFASADQLQRYVFWSFGSLGNLTWAELQVFSIVFFIGILFTILCIKSLNTLLLGDQYAVSMGVKLKQSRLMIILATSLLAGGITAFAGPIAFIGLAVPHLTKLVFHTSNHKVLIPAVLICGSILMLVCDSIAQLPGNAKSLPINAVTSLIGAPVVIWLLIRKKKMVV